jgi:hypothetical protein
MGGFLKRQSGPADCHMLRYETSRVIEQCSRRNCIFRISSKKNMAFASFPVYSGRTQKGLARDDL